MKQLFRVPELISLHQVPEYRAMYLASLIGLLFNAVMAPIMFMLELYLLGVWGIVGVLLWGMAFIANQKGKLRWSVCIGSFEIFTHANAGVVLLGTAYGFQYFLLACICIVAAFPSFNRIRTFLWCLLTLISFLALHIFVPEYTNNEFLKAYASTTFTVVVLSVAIPCLAGLMSMKSILIKHKDTLSFYSYHDGLSKLKNRRYFYQWIKQQIVSAELKKETFSFILVDLDNFKQINDTYGHHVGDEVIIEFAEFIKSRLREIDLAVRWGGEEFLIVLNNCSGAKAEIVMYTLIEQFAEQPLTKHKLSLSFSYGISQYSPNECIESLISVADKRMYRNKQEKKHFAFAAKSV